LSQIASSFPDRLISGMKVDRRNIGVMEAMFEARIFPWHRSNDTADFHDRFMKPRDPRQ
jgi:hypothetical protein